MRIASHGHDCVKRRKAATAVYKSTVSKIINPRLMIDGHYEPGKGKGR
jgi:hypothetical protein